MIFNREDILQKLNVAKLAIDSREFIPIMAHFCFQGKFVTAYNDFIGIQVKLHSNFACALQAGTLLQLLNSVRSEEIDLGFTDQRVFFKSGKVRTGVRARLPYMQESEFFFQWPNLKRLETFEFSDKRAAKFFEGIELCLTSVGVQTPTQMGITLVHDGANLKMYSTNNKAISIFSMRNWGSGFDNKILSTAFCKALLKAREQYPEEIVTFSMAKDFVLVTFGSECKIYGKLVNNKDPLDFGKVVGQYLPKAYKTKRQEIPPDFADGFQRSLLMLSPDLSKQVTVILDEKTVTIEAKSNLGKLKSGSKFATNWHADRFSVDAELAVAALTGATHVYFGDKAIIFSAGTYMHLLATSESS